jgi:negative regulator of flagellin synthesis FlgM
MKIDDVNKQSAVGYQPGTRAEKQTEAVDAHGEAAAKQQPAKDKVELSGQIPPVAETTQRQDTRVNRVEELKAQIAAGTYQVSSTAIAEKMLSKIVMR